MADLTPKGMVQSPDQIRAVRRSKGFCDTCRIEAEPVQCFEIKKRMGGMLREKVPLTRRGKVFNGTCLVCHPDRDPDGGRHRSRNRPNNGHHHRRPPRSSHQDHYESKQGQHPQLSPGSSGRPIPYNIDSGDAFRGDDWVKGNSLPSMGMQQQQRRPNRQGGYRDLHQSLPTHLQQQDSRGQLQQELENDYRYDDGQGEEARDEEYEWVEKVEYNIFDEPVTRRVKVRKQRDRHHSMGHQYDAPGTPPGRRNQTGARSPPTYQSNRVHNGHGAGSPPGSPRLRSPGYAHSRPPYYEEKVEEQADDNFDYPAKAPPYSESEERRLINGHGYDNDGRGPQQQRTYDMYGHGYSGQNIHPISKGQDSGLRPHPYHQDSGRQPLDEQKMPSVPDLAPVSNGKPSQDRQQTSSDFDEESLDELAALVARHCVQKQQKQETIKFVPGQTLHAYGELELQPMQDDEMTALTMDTCLRSRGTKGSSSRTNLTAISEGKSAESLGPQPSLASHEIKEPAAEHDMETYLESSAPELATLREIVGLCMETGDDEMAIETVTGALIHDNATSMSKELALFCLTTLWVLARKSDENKRTILLEGVTFDSIIEAMQIYREMSAEIQTRACGVLWSLSMDPRDRKHVAQNGGCDAILNAMLAYTDDDALQVMALGALKVLSFDNIGKSTLRSRGAPAIVADIMRRNERNPTIQSEGCVIIGNLAVDETNHFVAPVSEGEIDAVVGGVLSHPESLEVHEAACFTLMSLASSQANVELIRRNNMSRVALEMAFQKHPDDLSVNIYTLLRRLKFDSPNATERKS